MEIYLPQLEREKIDLLNQIKDLAGANVAEDLLEKEKQENIINETQKLSQEKKKPSKYQEYQNQENVTNVPQEEISKTLSQMYSNYWSEMLAHKLILNPDLKLTPETILSPFDTSIDEEYWNILKEKFKNEDTSFIPDLVSKVKSSLIDMTSHKGIKARIEEKLNENQVRQEIETQTFDLVRILFSPFSFFLSFFLSFFFINYLINFFFFE